MNASPFHSILVGKFGEIIAGTASSFLLCDFKRRDNRASVSLPACVHALEEVLRREISSPCLLGDVLIIFQFKNMNMVVCLKNYGKTVFTCLQWNLSVNSNDKKRKQK